MKAFVIKGWRSDGVEFFIGNVERGDGCWSESESLADAKLFSDSAKADKTAAFISFSMEHDFRGPGTLVVKTVTVSLEV